MTFWIEDTKEERLTHRMVERVLYTTRRCLVPGEVAATPEWRAVTAAASGENYRVLPVALEVLASHCADSLQPESCNLLTRLADALRCNRTAELNALLPLIERKPENSRAA